ncbi:TPA: hypothetical protein WI311_001934, partial [Neisseria meningitidis]
NDEILDYGNLSGMIESIEKSQESIRKNRNPHRVIPHRPSFPQKRESSNRKTTGIYQQKQKPPPTVIPAKAGIQKHNATGIYRKKQKPHRRHSRKSGNPDPSARKLTE